MLANLIQLHDRVVVAGVLQIPQVPLLLQRLECHIPCDIATRPMETST